MNEMPKTCPFCDHYCEAFSTCRITDDDVDPEYNCPHWSGDKWLQQQAEIIEAWEDAERDGTIFSRKMNGHE